MATIGPKVVIPILSMCALLFVAIIGVLIYYWLTTRARRADDKYRMHPGFTRRHTLELSCSPAPGIYQSAVEVSIHCSSPDLCDILLDVSYAQESNVFTDGRSAGGSYTTRLLGTDEWYGNHFMLYTEPLEFVDPGRYTVCAYTVYPTLRIVGSVHQFCFDVVGDRRAAPHPAETQQSEHVSVDIHKEVRRRSASPALRDNSNNTRPLPPRIIPGKGEVTTFTPITIAPNEESTTPDQIRYSVDGSHPSLMYTGPFTLSLPPFNAEGGSAGMPVVVRALAVSAHDGLLASETTEATLTVHRAGYSFLDPNVPAPVARIRALEADMYFDESKRPPNTNILYRLVYMGEAKQKTKFSRKNGIVYDGRPIPLKEDVAFVYAWTFRDDRYNSEFNIPQMNENKQMKERSSAAVYDCERAVSWNREPREEDTRDTSSTLPPPFICIRCKEMDVFFEDPPVGGIICYTLDGTEPVQPDSNVTVTHMAGIGLDGNVRLPKTHKKMLNMGTHVYTANQPIHVTLLRTEQVFLTARTFIPVIDPAANSTVTGYRFSERFNRGFTTQ